MKLSTLLSGKGKAKWLSMATDDPDKNIAYFFYVEEDKEPLLIRGQVQVRHSEFTGSISEGLETMAKGFVATYLKNQVTQVS